MNIKFTYIILFLATINTFCYSQNIANDSIALLEFYIENPNNTLNWDTSNELKNWEGITIKNNRIIEISVVNKNTPIFSESICNIDSLIYIKFNNTKIENIPSKINMLHHLERLTLYNNRITTIPRTLVECPNLTRISLTANDIKSIPSSFSNFENIQSFLIDNNNLGYSGLETLPNYFFSNNVITYSTQNTISSDTTFFYNNTTELFAPDSAVNNSYQWFKNGQLIINSNSRSIIINENAEFYVVISNNDFSQLNNVTSGKYSTINAGPFWTDSLALESLSNNNPTNNLNWSSTLRVKDWNGITHSGYLGDQVTAVDINNQGLHTIPSDIQNLTGLDSLILENNYFVFDDLYSTQGLTPSMLFTYSPQANLGEELSIGFTNDSIQLSVDPAITNNSGNNIYDWYKDGVLLFEDTLRTIKVKDVGIYHCEIRNNDFSELTLYQNNIFIFDQNLFDQDSIIVRSIAELNSDNTLGWDLDQPLSTWTGVTFRGGRLQSLQLNSKNLETLPANIGDLSLMESLEVNNNNITSIPISINQLSTTLKYLDFSNNNISELPVEIYELTALTDFIFNNNNITTISDQIDNLTMAGHINASNNFLTFDDLLLIKNGINPPSFEYAPQGAAGEEQYIATAGIISISVDDSIDPTITNNLYQWYFENDLIIGATDKEYLVNNQFGTFHVLINNNELPDLTLITSNIFVSPDEVNPNDSLALITLIDQNSQNTINWNITDPVGTWEGVIVNGETSQVVSLDVWSKNLDNFPDELTKLDELKSLNIANNNIYTLPDNMGDLQNLEYANFSSNHLPFSELDKVSINISNGRGNFVYSNQKYIGDENTSVTLENGFNYIYIPNDIITENDFYQWYRNGDAINGEIGDSLRVNNTGDYNYTITNSRYINTLLTSYYISVDGEVTSTVPYLDNRILIYPNPTSNYLKVQSRDDVRIVDVILHNTSGVRQETPYNSISTTVRELYIKSLTSGLYMVTIITNKGTIRKKVIKE
ncbi:T9SS type A sorting domain-containing protein [Flammeovirga agarivorans]|nr:T9SS type A sorting domain-containing protein [Flammeovirga agarivorans]